jgi:hypothetical protein
VSHGTTSTIQRRDSDDTALPVKVRQTRVA